MTIIDDLYNGQDESELDYNLLNIINLIKLYGEKYGFQLETRIDYFLRQEDDKIRLTWLNEQLIRPLPSDLIRR